MTNTHRKLYTPTEAAMLFGIGRSTVYDLIAKGNIESIKIGGRVFLTPVTIEAILGERPPSPSELNPTDRSTS